MYTTCVWVNIHDINMLFENWFVRYIEVSLSTVISTMEATSVLLFQSEGSCSFLLTQKHAVVGLSGACSPRNLRAAHGGAVLGASFWEALFMIQGVSWKSEALCTENLSIRWMIVLPHLGVGPSPCPPTAVIAWTWQCLDWRVRCQWPDLTASDHVRRGEGESEQVGGKLSLQSRKAGLRFKTIMAPEQQEAYVLTWLWHNFPSERPGCESW